jgi:hypothetical protein
MQKKTCVFCGNKPQNKNREHVLPQWLIALTGDPKRVVNFGINYETGKTVRFDWSNFVVPSCESCNSKYGELENRAKGYILKILERESLNSKEYIDLLDWFDKIRVALWINYHKLQGNPTNIEPSFHVDQRISKKDRMLAIYPIETNEKGLNAFGAETFLFHTQPSCFGLKINNIFIINMSSDYLFANRCGFPYPEKNKLWLDGDNQGKTQFEDYKIKYRIKHPLIRKHIIKPSVHIYQPIMPDDQTEKFQTGFLSGYNKFDGYLAKHTIPPYPTGKGILYRQYEGRVEPIFNLSEQIEFNSIGRVHCKPLNQLISQVYVFQKHIFQQGEYCASDKKVEKFAYKRKKHLLKSNQAYIDHYKSMGCVTSKS